MKKRCSKCKLEKDVSEFYSDKRAKDGLYSYCKICHYIVSKKAKGYKDANWKHQKRWRFKNHEHYRKYQSEYGKQRRKVDLKFRLDNILGSIIQRALKGKKEWRHWENLVGYTTENLIQHLEKQFDNRMNWNNFGNYWEIDHKKPKSLFKYKTAESEGFKECWGLNNLQPMEKIENRKKHNKF